MRILSLLLVITLFGCGGGGGGSPAPPVTPPPVTTTGVFLDSAVEGLTYQSGSNPSGTTDANGTFMYMPGEILTFSIGGVVLGTLPDGAPVITPFDFGGAAENIARFLQTLDADGDPSNGIDITAAAAALAGTIVGDAVFLSDATTFENDIGPVLEVASGAGVVLVDAATALANLEAGLDSTFDAEELANHAFVIIFPELDEIGIMTFAPLLDPGDSGSTVLVMLRSDTIAVGGDGTTTVFDWAVDPDGALTLTDPIALTTVTIEKAGGSARAISIVATEDSEEIVGTLLVTVTGTVIDLAGELRKTYDVVDSGGVSQLTFSPDGSLFFVDADGPANATWELDLNGSLITILNPADPEVTLAVLVNGSFQTGGDFLSVSATNLSGDPTALVLQLNEVFEGTLTPAAVPDPGDAISYSFSSSATASGTDPVLTALFSGLSVSGTFDYNSSVPATGVAEGGSATGSVIYGGSLASFGGSVNGMNFSDAGGVTVVGNDRLVPLGLTDILTVSAGEANFTGFEINGFTLVNVRMSWIEGVLGATDFLSSEDLPTALPDFAGQLSLIFAPTADPSARIDVNFVGLFLSPTP